MHARFPRFHTKTYSTRIVVQVRRPDGSKQSDTVRGRSQSWLRTVFISEGDKYQYYTQLISDTHTGRLVGTLREFGPESIYKESNVQTITED